MNRERVKKESKKWIEEGFISQEQAEKIVSYYPKRERSFILMSFAGLFIGLGFLTFIASNWSGIPSGVKMAILLVSMIAFYGAGYYIYQKKFVNAGASFLIIGLLIFGSGIFLTGQMYNYLFFSALPFLIWSLAGFVLYWLIAHPIIFTASIAILTIGQIYSGMVYQQFSWWIGLLLLIGFSHFTYHHARKLYGYLFALSFAVQALVLTFAEGYSYYWLLVFLLILYLLGDLTYRLPLRQPFWNIGLGSVFLIVLIQVFFTPEFLAWQELNPGWIFLVAWLVIIGLSVAMKVKNRDRDHFVDYILFLPVIYLDMVDILSLILLFVFSIGWLLIGYQRDKQDKVLIGTISLLISTVVAYSHFAWDFMDKSLFFFIGGLLLFLLSFFLERKRRHMKNKETGGQIG